MKVLVLYLLTFENENLITRACISQCGIETSHDTVTPFQKYSFSLCVATLMFKGLIPPQCSACV